MASVTLMSDSAEKNAPFVERAELSIATLMVESELNGASGIALLLGSMNGSAIFVPGPVGDW